MKNNIKRKLDFVFNTLSNSFNEYECIFTASHSLSYTCLVPKTMQSFFSMYFDGDSVEISTLACKFTLCKNNYYIQNCDQRTLDPANIEIEFCLQKDNDYVIYYIYSGKDRTSRCKKNFYNITDKNGLKTSWKKLKKTLSFLYQYGLFDLIGWKPYFTEGENCFKISFKPQSEEEKSIEILCRELCQF